MTICHFFKKRLVVFALGLPALISCGCVDTYPADMKYPLRSDPLVIVPDTASPAHFDTPGQFPHFVDQLGPKKEGKEILNPAKLTAGQKSQIEKALEKYFGTPAAPTADLVEKDDQEKVQNDYPALLKLEKETLAAGSKFYRQHCLHCHGLAGNGRGPTSAWVNPHPRDYRQGIFKFTSSYQGDKSRSARRADLLRTLRQGIEGTSMPSFGLLADKELEALASYVIHLSIRGQAEFMTMRSILVEEADPEEGIDKFLFDQAVIIAKRWKETEEKAIVPDEASFPKDREALKASIVRGYQKFQVRGQGCMSCHPDYGRKDNLKYDSWGTIVRPSDLTRGVYRGGRRPIDLYWRIHSGINGANMAASGIDPGKRLGPGEKPQGLPSVDIWDLVNFLLALPYPNMLPEEVEVELKKMDGTLEKKRVNIREEIYGKKTS